MRVLNIDTQEIVEIGHGIYQLEELIGNTGLYAQDQECRDLGCDFKMSKDDIKAWRDVIADASTVAEVYENAIAAGWTL